MDKKYVVSWDMLQNYVRTMAKRLLLIKKWRGIIAVSRGGLVPSALLARELEIRYVDTICISSYDNKERNNLQILKKVDGNGKNFIIVDDLVDTGETAKIIKELYPKAHLVTVFAKPAGRSFLDDYIIDIPQNTWIEQPWDMGILFVPPLARKN